MWEHVVGHSVTLRVPQSKQRSDLAKIRVKCDCWQHTEAAEGIQQVESSIWKKMINFTHSPVFNSFLVSHQNLFFWVFIYLLYPFVYQFS